MLEDEVYANQSTRPKGLEECYTNVSVIIPTLNEEDRIEACIASVRHAMPTAEIVVIDGGSHDRTMEIVTRLGAQVVESTRGRGQQMHTGAMAATGEILVFLHADARLGSEVGPRLASHFSDAENDICTLRIRFDGSHPIYRLYGWATHFDGLFSSYGDQCICIRAKLYESLGGFAPMPTFEDVDFLKRARERTKIRSLNATVHVSTRRFRENGILREFILNSILMLRYWMGADPKKLGESYAGRKPRR